MKQIFTLVLVLSCLALSAQNSVTFRVDMSTYTGSYGQVNLNGTFNDWCGVCAMMTDDDEDLVYEITVDDMEDGVHEYKFTLDGWDTDDEMFTPGTPCTMTTGPFTNRVIEVTEDVVLETVCWESCGPCGTMTSADVTFKVDMSEYSGTYSMVNLNGTFNDWCGACAVMTDDDSDGIYEITVNIPTGPIEYKFTLDGWTTDEMFAAGDPCTLTTDEFTNRYLDVTETTELEAVCWESCAACAASSLEEFSASLFSLFPNPSEGTVRIRTEAQDLRNLRVYDISGTEVDRQRFSQVNDLISLRDLAPGIYYIELSNEQQRGIEQVVIQ